MWEEQKAVRAIPAGLVLVFYLLFTLGRGYLDTAYVPMVELLGYLETNGFSNYIASGGGRDFMRPISQEIYGIPRDRVIGSASTFEYTSDATEEMRWS